MPVERGHVLFAGGWTGDLATAFGPRHLAHRAAVFQATSGDATSAWLSVQSSAVMALPGLLSDFKSPTVRQGDISWNDTH